MKANEYQRKIFAVDVENDDPRRKAQGGKASRLSRPIRDQLRNYMKKNILYPRGSFYGVETHGSEFLFKKMKNKDDK